MGIGTPLSVEYNVVKRFSGNRNKNINLWLSRYINQKYGVKIPTVYGKLRCGRFKPWEVLGVDECCRRFCGGEVDSPNEWFNSLTRRKDFLRHMASYGMSRATVYRKFGHNGISAYERRGFRNVVRDFLKEINEEIGEDVNE